MKKFVPVLGLFLICFGCGSSTESQKEDAKDEIKEIKQQLIGTWECEIEESGKEENAFYLKTDSTGSFSWRQERSTNDPYSSGMTSTYLACEGEIIWDVKSVDSLKHSEIGELSQYVNKALVVKTSSIRCDGKSAYNNFPSGWFETKERDFENHTFVIPILSFTGDSLKLSNQYSSRDNFFESYQVHNFVKRKN